MKIEQIPQLFSSNDIYNADIKYTIYIFHWELYVYIDCIG